MSSVSYASAAAGVTSTTAAPVAGASPTNGFKLDQTTTTEEVDDSSATTEEDVREKELETTKESSKPLKKEKSKAKLAPAPVPKVSAWGLKSSTSPAPSNVNEKHWPAPEAANVLEEQLGLQSKPKTFIPLVKSTGKEKWVPFQASVVMSGPKNAKVNNLNNSGNNQRKSNKGKKSSKQQQNDQKLSGPRRNQRQQKNGDHSEKREDSNVTKTKSESVTLNHKEKTHEDQLDETVDSDTVSTEGSKLETAQPHENTHSNQQQQPHHQHTRQYSNGNVRRYNNRHQQHNGFVPFNRNVNFIPPTYLPSGQVFQPRGFNQGFIPQQQQPGHPQQMDNFRRFNNGYPAPGPANFNAPYPNVVPFIPMNPAVQQINQINSQDPVTALAFQVDYYFSVQNLTKDTFLRKQMDSEGYIPLKVIANFYRVQHLSGGDLKLIVDSLDSCGNLEYTGDKDTFDLKLRLKENPHMWILPNTDHE